MDRQRANPVRIAATLAGVAAASALVWYVGPLVAVAGVVPLAGEPARWMVIAALVGLAATTALWRQWRQARRNGQLMEGLLADRAASPGEREVAVITERFERAVRLLRRSRVGGRRPWLAALCGMPYVYQLPWYMIIGAPGAGKTTALRNSGLEFPLADEVGREVVRGVGGTRHCDWWFTDRAVLIDTAGRYATHSSDRVADRTAWLGFLDLLATHRPRRPVNGVLLTVSASELLNADPARRDAHAGELRERIEELHARLGIGIPVYVLVTKTDLLAGFMEFFSDFDKDERAQVWGITFPHAPGPPAHAAADDFGARLAREFALLEKRLNDCMIERLRGERDREKRHALYAFPQEWRVLRQTLCEFLQTMLGGMRDDLRPLVRGVYFTSATQEGTPVDRALGGMARALGLAHRVIAPGHPSGKTFFVTRLLRDVVFAEAELAGINLRWRRRREAGEWAAVGLLLCTVLGGAALSWHAYAASEQRLRSFTGGLPALETAADAARRSDATDLVALLPTLDALASLAQADDARRTGPTGVRAWTASLTLGLDRSEMVGSAAEVAYQRALREGFLPRIAARMERRLRAGERDHVELIYETLRAYLMLFGGRNFDAAALRSHLRAEWDATLPPDVKPAQREALATHLDRLLATGEVGAPSRADASLVQRSRALVVSVPLAQRAYRRLLQAGAGAEAAQVTMASAGGAAAARLFARSSGQPLSAGVGAVYTRAVAGPSLRERTLDVLRQFAREESWVLGGTTPGLADPASQAQLVDEVQRLYLSDYAARWAAFIDDLRLAPTASLDATADLARQLARADSPLAAMLRSVVREVSVEGLPPPPVTASGTAAVDFEALKRYVSASPAALDEMQTLLGRVAAQLVAVQDAARRKALPPASEALRELRAAARGAPEPVRSMLADLAERGGTQSLALLREPLAHAMASELAPACQRVTGGRFPLVAGAGEEMSREDFTRTFASGGLLDGFFQSRIAPFIDTSARSEIVPKSASDARSPTDNAWLPFQRAQLIRDAFFSDGGRRLGTRLSFRLLDMDPALSEFALDIDGQAMRFRRGQSAAAAAVQSVQWPGPAAPGQVRLQVQPSSSSAYVFNGPWALFRLLERVRVEPGASPDRAVLQFDVEGRKARLEVHSAGPLNPVLRHELEKFQCPTRL